MPLFKKLLYRANLAAPAPQVPLGLRSVGHYRVGPGPVDPPQTKHFIQIYWGIAGQGRFEHPQGSFILLPEKVFLYFPGDTHLVNGLSPAFEYRFFTVDGPVSRALVDTLGLRREVLPAGACPKEMFMQLEAALRDLTAHGELRGGTVAFHLLSTIAGGRPMIRREDDAVARCVQAIEAGFQDPGLSVELLSQKAGLHRTSLSRLFRQRLGVSPQEYINSVRMQRAMSFLKETDLRASEIAYKVGFSDPQYFSRAFRKSVGLPPGAFRID